MLPHYSVHVIRLLVTHIRKVIFHLVIYGLFSKKKTVSCGVNFLAVKYIYLLYVYWQECTRSPVFQNNTTARSSVSVKHNNLWFILNKKATALDNLQTMWTQSGCSTDKEILTITLKYSAIHRVLSEMAFQNIVFYWFQHELFMAWFLVTTVY